VSDQALADRLADSAAFYGSPVATPLRRLAGELTPEQTETVLGLLALADNASQDSSLAEEARVRAQLWALLPALMEHARDALLGLPDSEPGLTDPDPDGCPCPCHRRNDLARWGPGG
jgi:hypothetical protein